jgi:hypothetical protein
VLASADVLGMYCHGGGRTPAPARSVEERRKMNYRLSEG